MAFSHRAAERGARLYEDLRDKIRASDIAHGDETHWQRLRGCNLTLDN
jgi:hypothetical protein